MFYHVKLGVTAIISWLETNKTREEVLTQVVCPFTNREITFFENKLFDMSSVGHVTVYETEKPTNSDWPVKKLDYRDEEGNLKEYEYENAVMEVLHSEGRDVTRELYREALVLLESGKYRELRTETLEDAKGQYCFFICPMDNQEVDHNYEYVIKPGVKQFRFDIQRVDEISHTGTITDEIMRAIDRSRFIIADLTDARPNCYYEVGYAHAQGKPVIILAKEGTPRHFDISTYKWNFWEGYKDLKPKLEKELSAVLRQLGIQVENTSA